MRNSRLFTMVLLLAFVLTACGRAMPSEAALPEVTATTVMLPTETATMVPPTPTLEPTATATITPTATPDLPYWKQVPQEEVDFLASHEFNTGDTSRNVIMITYDDGGFPSSLRYVMDSVEKYGGKLTFFFPGTWLQEYPEMAQEIVARGHLLECHGWDHTDMSKMSETELREQFEKYFTLMDEVLPGYKVKFIRFPFGARNDLARQVAAEYGLQSVMWGVESGGKDENTYGYVVNRSSWGSVVLSHTNRKYDLYYAASIMSNLASQGYVFETVETARAAEDVWNGN